MAKCWKAQAIGLGIKPKGPAGLVKGKEVGFKSFQHFVIFHN